MGGSVSSGSNKGVVIEELDFDDEREVTARASSGNDMEENCGSQRQKDVSREPLVEHPENGAEENKGMIRYNRSNHNMAQRAQDQTNKLSVHTCKITYGGVDGAYYTSTRTRSSGSNGVVLEESREADKSTGQATHRISRAINDKGHSVTRKLKADGEVETMQTLHNLNEDQLTSFEKWWKTNQRHHEPTWNNVHDMRFSEGFTSGSRTHPFNNREMVRPDQAGRSTKKVVRINIE